MALAYHPATGQAGIAWTTVRRREGQGGRGRSQGGGEGEREGGTAQLPSQNVRPGSQQEAHVLLRYHKPEVSRGQVSSHRKVHRFLFVNEKKKGKGKVMSAPRYGEKVYCR